MPSKTLLSALTACLAVAGCAGDDIVGTNEMEATAGLNDVSHEFVRVTQVGHPIWRPSTFTCSRLQSARSRPALLNSAS